MVDISHQFSSVSMQYLAFVSFLHILRFSNKCILSRSRNRITTSLAIIVKHQYIKGCVHSMRLSQVTLTQQPGSDRMIISLATSICRHASSLLCFSEASGITLPACLQQRTFLSLGKFSFAVCWQVLLFRCSLLTAVNSPATRYL